MKKMTLAEKWRQPRVVINETNWEKRPPIMFEGPGLTDRSQKKDCDVNVIVDRFMKTGVLPGVDVKRVYGDFSAVPDYQEACNIVARAEEQFMGLHANVRKRFNHNPSEFLAFVNDPKNAKEMIDLGLATLRPNTASESMPEAKEKTSKKNPPASKSENNDA